MVGGRVLGGEGVWPGYVVAHPASPLGPLSHERPRHTHPFSPMNLVSSKKEVLIVSKKEALFATNRYFHQKGNICDILRGIKCCQKKGII